MNLYLMRHAIAADAEGDQADHLRPLTPRGMKKLRKIAHNLEKQSLELDWILTSPYLRARQTAEVVAEILSVPADRLLETRDLAPSGSSARLVDEIRSLDPIRHVLVVGHEPYLGELAGMLLAGDHSLQISFRKAAVCNLSIPALTWGRCATLEWLLTPALLTGD